ncbi:MAG TPA: DUF1467 family protein [Stellaceae bacterium]|nr:DUF1467 family protein [Stellaceae bacterium]
MNWFTGVASFVVIWWLALFAILPIGVKPAEDDMGKRVGAPANPQLGRKAIWTTLVAIVLWGILYVITISPIWSMRQ